MPIQNSIINHELNGHIVPQQRNNGYINLTKLCAAGGKKLANWNQMKSVKTYLEELSSDIGIPISSTDGSEALIVYTNARGDQSTWGHPEVAVDVAKWVSIPFRIQVNRWFVEWSTNKNQQNASVSPKLPEVTDKTIEVHSQAIQMFSNSGDLQLAQLLKSRLGNLVLAEQQQLLASTTTQAVVVEQYEGAVDVAIRLGFSVPSNYEGSLGMAVKKKCEYLLIGKNNRYSTTSQKQVPANMYPANHPEVEAAVKDYCVRKAFKHRDITILG